MIRLLCCLLAWWLLLSGAAGADEPGLKEVGRRILSERADAVIFVKVVVATRHTFMGRDMARDPQTYEVPATVIGPDGLTVMSNFLTDPMEAFSTVVAGGGGKGGEGLKVESEVTDVKMILADGSELAARFVLRDRDLDLAFVRPVASPAKPMAFVQLSASAAPLQVLDDLIVLGRLGRAGNRESTVELSRVQAVMHKPRLMWVPAQTGSFGCPVFAASGDAVGISLMRIAPGRGGGGMFQLMGRMEGVVLPGADVLQAASQAK